MMEIRAGSKLLVIQKVQRSDWSVVTLYNDGVLLYSRLMFPDEVEEAKKRMEAAK